MSLNVAGGGGGGGGGGLYFLDLFNAVAYNGNDGTLTWSGDWQESGESDGPNAGKIRVVGNRLRVWGNSDGGESLHREADLSDATTATLTFNYQRDVVEPEGSVTVQVSGNGGASWTSLKTYNLTATDPTPVPESFDITSYIASNTQIRFLSNGGDDDQFIYFGDVQISINGGGGGSSPGTPATLATSADTFIKGLNGSNNGSDDELKVGRDNGGPHLYSLLRFDVSSVPAGTAITSATLRLYQFDSNRSGNFNARAYRIDQDWTESGADWSTADGATAWSGGGGGTYSAPPVATTSIEIGTDGWYEWDVTSLMQEWVDGISPNYGIQITYDSVNAGRNVSFASKEHSNAERRPQLVIEY